MRIKSIIGILAVLFLVWSIFPAFAEDFTNVSECMNITQSGNYRLVNSISGLLSGKNYCINISANDVVLDGQGFSVTGSGSETGILVQANNVTIKNVSVSAYGFGIYLSSSSSNTIANNTISNNNNGGGISFYYSSNNTVTDNSLSGNHYNIYLYSSSYNRISDCKIANIDKTMYGIYTYGPWYGQPCDYGSNYNIFENNTISDTYYGILIESPRQN
ncbi:MAG: right-handed parallel beta-helix repeat-containing protein [Archaeoglobaceae archaeon]